MWKTAKCSAVSAQALASILTLTPPLIRLGFVILACIGGSGILAYLASAIIIPKEN